MSIEAMLAWLVGGVIFQLALLVGWGWREWLVGVGFTMMLAAFLTIMIGK